MAYIRRQGKKWRVEIERNGVRRSATFNTKAEATLWAGKVEAEILAVKRGAFPQKTFADAMRRYADEVSPTKKGQRYELLRLALIEREFPWLSEKIISDITPADMSRWRDERLSQVSPGSVQRELNLLGSVFTVARKEWGWCGDSPISSIKRPGNNPPRDRRITPSEVKRICRQLGYVTGSIQNKQQEVALAFLISLRTAMRAGEVLSLNAERVNLKDRVLTVPHKTQHITGKERQIPITKKAARLIGVLADHGYFSVSSSTLDALFRRARDVQGIKNLHFHDARAEALTRLSRKVDVMTLAKISGHRDLSILQNTYYRETAADIAARI